MRLALPGAATVLAAACAAPPASAPSPTVSSVVAAPTVSVRPSARPSVRPPVRPPSDPPDPRWRFYTADRTYYRSPWYAGRHRIMVGFGCTRAPWYDPDPACPGHEGSHHGIDVAMPCGTPLYAGAPGVVLSPAAPGTPGAAYGVAAFRIRAGSHDILVGHARAVFVRPGDRVRRGERIALASDSGAPDGCHLHLEVRPHGGDFTTAVDPSRWLRLHR